MNQEQINELRQLAQAATPGPWRAAISSSMVNSVCTTFETVCETGKNIDDALYIAAANPAAVLELIRQRDELLASLKEARELVEDWGAYAPAYMQEKHDLEGDLSRLDAVISKMETP